ncbi:MAG: MopE-related protein [Bacteroidota bacterium]
MKKILSLLTLLSFFTQLPSQVVVTDVCCCFAGGTFNDSGNTVNGKQEFLRDDGIWAIRWSGTEWQIREATGSTIAYVNPTDTPTPPCTSLIPWSLGPSGCNLGFDIGVVTGAECATTLPPDCGLDISSCPADFMVSSCDLADIVPTSALSFSGSPTNISLAQFTAEGGVVSTSANITSITYEDVVVGNCPKTVTRTFIVSDDCPDDEVCVQTITLDDPAQNTVITTSGDLCVFSATFDQTGNLVNDRPEYQDLPAGNLFIRWNITQWEIVIGTTGEVIHFNSTNTLTPPCSANFPWSTGPNSAGCGPITVAGPDCSPTALNCDLAINSCPVDFSVVSCDLSDILSTSTLAFSANDSSITQTQFIAEGGTFTTANNITSFTYQDELVGNCPKTVTRTFTIVDDCPAGAQCIQTIILDDPSQNTFITTSGDFCIAADTFDVTGNLVNGRPEYQSLTSGGAFFIRWSGTQWEIINGSSGDVVHFNSANSLTPPCSADFPWSEGPQGVGCGTIMVAGPDCSSCDLAITSCPTDPGAIEGCTATDVSSSSSLPFSTAVANITETQFIAEGGALLSLGNITSITYQDVASGSCPIVVSRTFTVMDDCPNTETCVQTFIIDDTTAPVISTCPPTFNVEGCSTGDLTNGGLTSLAFSPVLTSVSSSDFVNEGGVVADNCNIQSYEYQDAVNGTCPIVVTRTWTITDLCGNAVICNQNILIEDNIAPMVACQNISVSLSANGDAAITPVQVFDALNSNDNCTGSITPVSVSPDSFTCSNEGANVVTLTAEDLCGNQGSCLATVTIEELITNISISTTAESCAGEADGSITAAAVAANGGQIGYSIDGGVNFNLTGNFTGLAPGNYTVLIKVLGTPNVCEETVAASVAAGSPPPTWYKDLDDDGYSDGVTIDSCAQPAGYKLPGDLISLNGDCDDNDPNKFLGNTEICDGQDNDCDGTVDEGFDVDGDGVTTCSGDCDDNDPNNFPGNTEICDGQDNDCDGTVDEGFVDTDNDGLADCVDPDDDNDGCLDVDDLNPLVASPPFFTTPCPANIDLCGAQNVFWAPPVATDDCAIPASTSSHDPGDFFNVGTTTVTYSFTDAGGNTITCSFDVVIQEAPTVNITQSSLPDFCQGFANLTANVSNPNPPLSYSWSGGLGSTQTVTALSNGTFTVTITDANGCVGTASTVVNVAVDQELSGYVMIAKEKLETKRSTVNGGGVGVLNNGGEAKLDDQSVVNTFVKADNVDVTGGSTAAQVIQSPAGINLPDFRSSTNSNNNHITVSANQTVTLTGSSYGKIEVLENATLIFDNPEVFTKEIKTKEGATIEFSQPTELLVKGELLIDKENEFNPTGEEVTVYLKKKLEVKEDSDVSGVIYTKENIETKGESASKPTNMNGLFIAKGEIKSDKWTNWNWNPNCALTPPPVNSLAQDDGTLVFGETNENRVGLKIYPNPAGNEITVRLPGFDDELQITFFDQFGRTIWRQNLSAGQRNIDLSNNRFVSGIYFVSVVSEGQRFVQRLVIAK